MKRDDIGRHLIGQGIDKEPVELLDAHLANVYGYVRALLFVLVGKLLEQSDVIEDGPILQADRLDSSKLCLREAAATKTKQQKCDGKKEKLFHICTKYESYEITKIIYLVLTIRLLTTPLAVKHAINANFKPNADKYCLV